LNAKKLTIRYAERKIRPAEISYKLWCLHCIIWQWFSNVCSKSKSRRQEKNYKPTHCTSTMQSTKVVTFLELQQKPQRQMNQKKSQELESIF